MGQHNLDHIRTASKNWRISFAGSSVTWGGGFLQSGLVKEAILNIQRNQSITVEPDMVKVLGNSSYLSGPDNQKYFDGKALKITGINSSIKFSITGDEITLVQGIERDNHAASEIEVYIDGNLYDTINNWNTSPIGIDKLEFKGDGVKKQFDLGRAFTFRHQLLLNEKILKGDHNQGGYGGGEIPKDLDYLVIRKYGKDKHGDPEVHHWISFKTAPAKGDKVLVAFSYGEEISYEKTTIGKSDKGELESPFGDGDVSFDITKPTRVSSGLDFRETDDRAMKTYRFETIQKRDVELKIKGNYKESKGIPYFIFNLATNRIFYFQNAGIGGWKLAFFNNPNEFYRGYKKIASFSPDILYIETTPNDDWSVKGYKLYTEYPDLSLTELQSIRTLPIKSITYNKESDTYNFQKWVGRIDKITAQSVTYLADKQHQTDALPRRGDYVFLGGYYSNNKEYVVRKVDRYDDTKYQIFFDKPITAQELIYKDIETLKGMEIRVRSLSVFEEEFREFIAHMRKAKPELKIASMVNPLPIIGARELWGYWDLMNDISKDIKVDNLGIQTFYDYQYSQSRDKEVVVDANALKINPLTGYMEASIDRFDGKNRQNYEVIVNGKNVYGLDAVVRNPYAYGVDTGLKKEQLNMDYRREGVRANQGINQKMELVFLKNAPKSGKIHIRFSTKNWSGDGCHVRTGDDGSKLYGEVYYDYFNKLEKESMLGKSSK
ncbi:hypothetical protein [Pseudopedobacter beijingensis]|uniref:Uncharacterized protein n=1 Tax=Pseudopedobacter beijingensis TaxID=1207056 RepID=A0ABW4IH79_9SPHI